MIYPKSKIKIRSKTMSDKDKRDELMEEMALAVKTIDKIVDESKGRLDSLENTTVKKASDAAAKAIEDLQTLETKVNAQEERQKDIELELSKKDGEPEEDLISKEYSKELNTYFRKNVAPSHEVIEKAARFVVETKMFAASPDMIEREVKDMVTGVGPDGGYFITPDRMPGFKTRLFETSPIRGEADIQSSSSTTYEIILDDDEAACGWVGEITARPKTDTAQIGKVIIPMHEIYANPRASQKQLDNAGFNLEQFINNKSIDKISRTENTAFVSGDGSQKPKGFLTYSDWTTAGTYERDAVEQVDGTDSTAGISSNDLITLQNTLHDPYQANAVFGMARLTFSEIMKFKGTDGHYLLDRNMLLNSADRRLLGKRIVIMSDMPALATSSLSVIYGNFKDFYTIVDGIGVRILRDPYTAKPYVQFYTTKNTGGAVSNFEAAKILKSNTVV